MSAPLPLLKMDKRSEPTMNHTSWRCIFKISAESGGVHGSGHWVSSSALPGVSIVIIIININHHHIIWIIFPWLYLTLNLNLFNVEAMFGSCCWSKCLLCFKKAFYIRRRRILSSLVSATSPRLSTSSKSAWMNAIKGFWETSHRKLE